MIGELWPRPGIAVFHATFSLALQLRGRPDSEDTPDPPGPRHCGQFFCSGSTAPEIDPMASTAEPDVSTAR